MSKDPAGRKQKGVKKGKVKRQYTPFKVESVNFDGYRCGSSDFLPTTATSSPIAVVRSSPIVGGRSEPIPLARILPIEVDYPLLGVDALKLYMTLTRVDSLYRTVWVFDQQAVLFATNVMMHNERKLHDRVQRIIMNPMYTCVVECRIGFYMTATKELQTDVFGN
ncbi:hypothetical protein DEO72_LG11g1963 [Vigna unguiculata]|uniref:Uncharacterized protein n=1 Tax=Vigna unguiculata TaxID=3917 RepID=A0A4D6NRQ5_VIGUN|nr:hypothetical protein DEO72_LG11g1963 [Vigna unguiculata]